MLLICVLVLCQMILSMFKPRIMHNSIQGNGAFHLMPVGIASRLTPDDTTVSDEQSRQI